MAPSKVGRRFCFTINNPTIDDGQRVVDLCQKSVYLIAGDEVGSSGTPHIQGYVVFSKSTRLSKVSKLLPRAYIAVAKGTSEENRTYCSKGGKFEEYGNCPNDCRITSDSNLAMWQHAYDLARANRIEDIRPDLQIRFIRAFERIRDRDMVPPVINDKLYNFWIYGPTGLGKTKFVFDNFPDHFKKLKNKWWDNYKGQQVVCMQEFGKKHEMLSEHLKEWADHYPFNCERKGSCCEINFKCLIITSNWAIEEIWQDENVVEPLLRRFRVYRVPDLPSAEVIQEVKDYILNVA
ncbi:rep protein [Circoviridae sp.]|nr:rep protein [Circoviridae sp.]